MTTHTDTQKAAIRDYLLLGLPLNPLEAWKKFGTSKLATRCSEMVRDGQLPGLQKKWIEVRTRYGTTRVMQYQIPQPKVK